MTSLRLSRLSLIATMLLPALALAQPTITSGPNYGTWSVGEINAQLLATGGNGTYSWSLISGSLPPGIAVRADVPSYFDPTASAGLIGVATTPGTYNFTLQVISNGQSSSLASSITISPLIVKDEYTLPDGFVGTSYPSYFLTALNNEGPVTWTFSNGSIPPGMSFSPSGVLSGTPTAAGVYNWNVEVTDGVSTVFRGLQVNVYAVQITTPGQLTNATVNTPYSVKVLATGPSGSGCCTFSVSSNGLPNGLNLQTSGIINGTAPPYPGIWNFSITASAGGVSYTKNMSLEVVTVPPTLPDIQLYGANNNWDDCSIGVPCSRQVFGANGGVAPFKSWVASGLPPGMSIRSGDGVTSSYVSPSAAELWGTPTALGNYSVQVTVTDANGGTATNTFPLKVSRLLVDGADYIPSGTIGVPYSKTLRVIGGSDSYSVSQIAGQLPDGLTFNPASFLLSGTPLENGPYFNTAFEFKDTAGNSLQQTFYYSISDGSSTLTIGQGYNLGNALLDSFYDNQLTACCIPAYIWSFVSGTLPPGLTLSASGELSGTPISTGTYTFLVQVADASNSANTGYRLFSLTVTPIYLVQNNGLPYGNLPYGNVGTSYNQTISASGGAGTTTWALQPFNYLPAGLTLAPNGTISGVPSQPGQFNFGANATDTAGNSLSVYFSLSIYPAGVTEPLNLPIGPNLGTFAVGGLTFQLQAVGGTPPYTYSLTPSATVIPGMRVVNGTVPTYFQTNVTGGYIGVITAPGTYSTSLTVTDHLGKVFDQPITLTVLPLNILVGDGNMPNAELATPYSYTFPSYGGSGDYTWSATNLPPGMSIDSATGALTGTATTPGTYYPQVKLEDITNSTSITQGFTLIVDPFSIATDGVLPQGTVNVAYNQALSAPNCGSGCTWTILGSLPGGLSLSPDGVISGSPNYTTTQYFRIQASGSNGTVQKQFSIQTVSASPQPLSITTSSPIVCCTASLGAGIAFPVVAAGGAPPYTWSVTSGSPPTGITLHAPGETLSSDSAPGETYLWGKPVQAGTYTFTLQVQDSAGKTFAAPFTWVISPLWFEYPNLPNPGTTLAYNTPYTQPMLVMGGSGNYTSWSALTPMPPGLSLGAATGVISGTPTNTGYFSSEIQVKDDLGNSSAQYINFNIAGPTPTLVNFGTGPNLGVWQPAYTATINLNPNGGTPPYTITALSALPPGFALESGASLLQNGNYDGAYELVGQPLAQGTFSFTLQATDSAGNIGVRTFTISIPPFTLYTNTNLADGSVGTPYSQQLVTWDSSSTVSFTLAPGSAFPPGLGVASGNVISGTPTAAGQYSFQLNGTDASGLVIRYFFNVRISNISISNAQPLPQATQGVLYNYALSATGSLSTLTWSASGLPSGLSMSSSGVINGTTTSTGTYWVTITATDGTIPVSTLTALYVNTPNPTELDYYSGGTSLPDATVGSNYSYNLIADGGVPPYTWSVAPGSSLPPGLNLISGAQLPSNVVPTITQLAGAPTTVGLYTFDLIATDSKGAPVRRTFTLKVSPLNVLWGGGLPNATVNALYSKQFTPVGGTPPYTFTASATALDADVLPPGMSLSAAGLLSGTPTSTGRYSFYLTLQDSAGNSYKSYQSLVVANTSGLFVTSGNLYDDPLGIATGVYLSTNGSSTYNWTVSGGTLPPGFSILNFGPNASYVYGAPSAAGTYVFTLRATDAANSSNFADHTFTFHASPIDVIISRIHSFGFHALPTGQVGQPYTFAYHISGGTPPYKFVESPFTPLPAGLTLESSTGVLSGTPTQIGNYSIQPIITDSAGNVFEGFGSTFVITPAGVAPPLVSSTSFGGAELSAGVPLRESYLALDPYIQTGTPPYTWSVTASSSLPPGMAILPGSNGVSSYLGGTPTTPGDYSFNLTASDASGQSLTINFELLVSPLAISPGVLPTGSVGTTYSVVLSPSGGTPPYAFQSAYYGDMPPGLSLSPTGVLSGTPTSAGYFYIQANFVDSLGLSHTEAFGLTIDNSAGQVPAITLGPDPIRVSYVQGAPNPAAIPVTVSSTTGVLAYEISVAGVPGATLSSTGGTTPSTVNLNLNTSGVAPGVYTGLIAAKGSLSANLSDATPVILTVTSTLTCSYTLTPSSGSVPIDGGSGSFGVNADPGCGWSASVSDPTWISLTSAATGSGPGTVSYSVAANATGAQRTGSITVADQTYTITQFGPGCSFALSPTTLPVGPGGATAVISVITSGPSCGWSASGLGSTPASGTGSGTVTVTVPANPNPTAQTPTATIAGQTLTVNEAGTSCAVNLGASSATFSAASGSGSVTVTTPAGCSYSTITGPSWISLTSGSSGTGPGTLAYTVSPNSTTAARTGSFSVGGQLFTIVQQALACSVTVDTSGLGGPYPSSGGNGSIIVTTNGPSCSWTASSASIWATVSPVLGRGAEL